MHIASSQKIHDLQQQLGCEPSPRAKHLPRKKSIIFHDANHVQLFSFTMFTQKRNSVEKRGLNLL